MKIPAHVWAFAVAALVLVLSTVLILNGHPVPTWWTYVALSAIAGGLGIAIPPGLITTATAAAGAAPPPPEVSPAAQAAVVAALSPPGASVGPSA